MVSVYAQCHIIRQARPCRHASHHRSKGHKSMSTTSMQQDQIPAYQQPVDAVLTTLDTDARRGLSDGEARARLERYGRNELTAEQPIPRWRKFLAQFHD